MDIMDRWSLYIKGDQTQHAHIAQHYLPLVETIAAKLKRRLPASVEFDDLKGYGAIGLLEAISRYNPDSGNKFETFAGKRIHGSIIDGLRAIEWAPRSVYTDARKVDVAAVELTAELNRTPNNAEIANYLGWESARVDEAQMIGLKKAILSLDQPSSDDPDAPTIGSSLRGEEEPSMNFGELQDSLTDALGTLSEQERAVVFLHYIQRKKFSEIGEMFDVSESRICQIHTNAIDVIRDVMTK